MFNTNGLPPWKSEDKNEHFFTPDCGSFPLGTQMQEVELYDQFLL